jgi:hypothetical protein
MCREKLSVGPNSKFQAMNQGGLAGSGGLVASEVSFNVPHQNSQQKPNADPYYVAERQVDQFSMPPGLYAANIS